MDQKYRISTPNSKYKFLETSPVAFFSAEYAFDDTLPIYAGGLGVLAADFLQEAGAAGLPVAALGLFYEKGFEAHLEDQMPAVPDPGARGLEPLRDRQGRELMVKMELDDHIVAVRVWRKILGSVHLFLLDTNVAANRPADRAITANLYPSNFQTKLLQEIVFGVSGIKLLRQLGLTPGIYHLNEGHTGFVALTLAVEYLHDHPEEKKFSEALRQVRAQIVATKHTILPGSGLFFTRDDFRNILATYLQRHRIGFDDFCAIGSWEKNPDVFSMTKFLLQSAGRANAVSRLHAVFEKAAHPHSRLFPITNGVSPRRWQMPELLDQNSGKVPHDRALWQIHESYRAKMTGMIRSRTGIKLDPRAMTVVWARRLAVYKRPALLLADPARLARMVQNRARSVQFIFAGQANRADEEGLMLWKKIQQLSKQPEFYGRLVHLNNYSLQTAECLTRGADIWLNTPERGKEASGTSGMKAGLNGVLQFTTSDGWADEIDWGNIGWVLPNSGPEKAIYDILEREILPLFHGRDEHGLPLAWLVRMKKTIKLVEDRYTTARMLSEYINKLYFPDEHFQ